MGQEYKDFRPIRQGDVGWTPDLQKARRYYSPSTGEIISQRERYNRLHEGKRYEQVVKEKQQQEKYVKKTYTKHKQQAQTNKKVTKLKTKKPVKKVTKKSVKKKQKKQRTKEKLKKQPLKQLPPQTEVSSKYSKVESIFTQQTYDYWERADFLKNKYAWKNGEIDFNSLSNQEKTAFWEKYHQLVYRDSPPSLKEFIDDEYDDFFDLSYEEVDSITYGDTP